jgi:hypothetical protein
MIVYGYDDNKNTHAVELSIEKIVARGIDPWRLDLFDEEPISLDCHEQRLYFRKLRDLSFAYWRGQKLLVGMHNGAKPGCVWGEWDRERSNPGQICLSAVTSSHRPFEEHFSEYLKNLHQRTMGRTQEWLLMGAPGAAKADWAMTPRERHQDALFRSGILPPPARTIKAFQAKASSAVSLQGSALLIEVGEEEPHHFLRPGTFAGEMFAERKLPMNLPEQVNWLLRTFKRWRPVVTAPTIRALMRGKAPKEICFECDKNQPSLEIELMTLGGQVGEIISKLQEVGFSRNGQRYRGSQIYPSTKAGKLHADPTAYSADDVFAFKENAVLGTRIAAFDIGRNQARAIKTMHPDRRSLFEQMAALDYREVKRNQLARLKTEGFTILPESQPR